MLIIRSKRPSEIVEFVKNNQPQHQNGTPGDTWKKYLQANGGTGDTFHDLEMSHTVTGWATFLGLLAIIGGTLREKMGNYLRSIQSSNSFYLTESGDQYLTEDGSGSYILE